MTAKIVATVHTMRFIVPTPLCIEIELPLSTHSATAPTFRLHPEGSCGRRVAADDGSSENALVNPRPQVCPKGSSGNEIRVDLDDLIRS